METISVHTAQPYNVLVGEGLLDEAGERIRALICGHRAMIVSDSNVAPRYALALQSNLEAVGFSVRIHTFAAGEASKSPETLLALINHLAQEHFTRHDVLVALGGGVTGDLGGLAASLYMRGMPCVQIPTSLLAMVDSSVGGKTAVNLPTGKNLLGTFSQPKLVLCDPKALTTLPEEEWANGWAEIIKYAFLEDKPLLGLLQSEITASTLTAIIAQCVRIKEGIVSRDEEDHGERALLNFGHTVGHAIEQLSGFTIPHGRAVGMGMAKITRAQVAMGVLPSSVLDTLLTLLARFGLSDRTPWSAEELVQAARADKKSSGERITLILPRALGHCVTESVTYEDFTQRLVLAHTLETSTT